MHNILFVDGENFRKKIKDVLIGEKLITKDDEPNWRNFNFAELFNELLEGIEFDRKVFYFAKIEKHPDTIKKSEELIERRRLLKNFLESPSQNFEVIIAGRVRGYYTDKAIIKGGLLPKVKSGRALVFDEKGVDVKIAVDMVSLACDGNLNSAILASSDSDLLPAIKELIKRGKKCIYIGFEASPNKGISFSTNRTRLIRNSEIVKHFKVETIRSG